MDSKVKNRKFSLVKREQAYVILFGGQNETAQDVRRGFCDSRMDWPGGRVLGRKKFDLDFKRWGFQITYDG